MLPFVVTGLGAAVGAVLGAIAAQASREKDRQQVKHYEIVNTELIDKYNNLVKSYEQLSAHRDEETSELTAKLAHFEEEKKLFSLVIRLQNELIALMEGLEQNISGDILTAFEEAIAKTNVVLKALDLDLVSISPDYLIRQKKRIEPASIVVPEPELQLYPLPQQNQTNLKKFYLEDCLL